MEEVTVAITNYNGVEHLPHCIEAVRALDYPRYSLLVVDNASTDGSVALLRERYPDVRLIELEENRGPGPARNAALREATTDLVFCIDNDAVLTPACLTKLVKALRADERVVACQPRVVYDLDPDRIHYDGGEVHFLGMCSLWNFREPVADCAPETKACDILIAVAILFDRTKLERDDRFDEEFFIFFEDQELAHRLRLKGHRILIVSGARVRHREGTAGVSWRPGGTLTDRRAYFFTRNRWMLIGKNYATRSLVVLAPALLAYEAVWMLFLTSKGRLGSYVRGIRDALRARPRIREERRRIQQSRQLRDRDILAGARLTFAVPKTDKPLQSLIVAIMNAFFKGYWRCVRFLV